MQKTILHVDINSYFATLLQQENPHLRGKAIGVVKDVGRTCLIAVSKEAKKVGVVTGSRLKDAQQLCPQILAIPASFERYLDATKRLQRLFAQIAPSVYIYSLDEAFIDITDCQQHLYPNVQTLAQTIQTHIKDELGQWVTCNIGIAENRLLAKMASETAPKGAVLAITEENKDGLLATTTFEHVCGIGYRLSKKLALLNVTVPYQIRFIKREDLEPLVGIFWTNELYKIAYGKEPLLLKQIDRHQEHMKSVGRSITGYRLYSKDDEIQSILANLCLEIIDKVRTMRLAGRQVWIGLYGQQTSWSTHITLKSPLVHVAALISEVLSLYVQWPKNFKVIKFAVRLSLLEPHQQPQLLPQWQTHEAIQTALDAINKKFGLFTTHPASIQKEHLIRPEVTGFLGDRIYQLRE